MSNEILMLSITAASIGFFHTLLGPDHYLPFIVLSKSGNWSLLKTIWITVLCGIGHVASSVILGIIGIMMGIAVSKLEYFESFRGNIAAWFLIGFGFLYLIWGIRQSIRNKPHTHLHFHNNKGEHAHTHKHHNEHVHVHSTKKNHLTPWILFTIFVFGPCEPLIPILMYPAAKSNIFGAVVVATVFSIITILTMLTVVVVALMGVNFIPFKRFERYIHVIAGATIFLSGLGIQFLGL